MKLISKISFLNNGCLQHRLSSRIGWKTTFLEVSSHTHCQKQLLKLDATIYIYIYIFIYIYLESNRKRFKNKKDRNDYVRT